MSEEHRVESMEDVLAHLVAEIQTLQTVVAGSAEPGGTTSAKWVVEQLDNLLTVQLPDGREVYLGAKTSEPWEVDES